MGIEIGFGFRGVGYRLKGIKSTGVWVQFRIFVHANWREALICKCYSIYLAAPARLVYWLGVISTRVCLMHVCLFCSCYCIFHLFFIENVLSAPKFNFEFAIRSCDTGLMILISFSVTFFLTLQRFYSQK